MTKKIGKSGYPRLSKNLRVKITATISQENRDWLDALGPEVSKSQIIDKAITEYRRKKK